MWHTQDIIELKFFNLSLISNITELQLNFKELKDFFISYLASPRPTVDRKWANIIPHLMLITKFYLFDLKFTRSPVTRLGPKTQLSKSAGSKMGTFWSRVEVQSHCTNLAEVMEEGIQTPSHVTFKEKQLKIRFCACKFGQDSSFKERMDF